MDGPSGARGCHAECGRPVTRRRARLSDFSIPLGVASIILIGALLGWRVAVIVVLAAVVVSAIGIVALSPWRQRLRGTTMDAGDRPLLLHLYSPY